MERSSVHIAVLVVAEDPATVDLASATFLSDKVMGAGHRVVAQEIVEADESAIRDQLARWVSQGHIDAIVSAGATEPAVAALGPLVTSPLQGLTDQLRLLARDRGGEGKPAAARCGGKFVFLLPAEVAALGAALNQLVLPQLDSTQPRNLVSEMPRHGAVPQQLAAEKTASGAGLVPKLPAREKRRTGANVIARPARGDDATKTIGLESLERKIAQSGGSHDTPTRPHIDIASMLPPVPPGADPDTAETGALPASERAQTWDDVATPPPLTVQPSRLRSGPIGTAVGTSVGNDDKTAMRPAPTRPADRSDDKTAIRPAPTRDERRPASQTNRGVQPTPARATPVITVPPLTARPAQPTPAAGTARPAQATPSIGSVTVRPAQSSTTVPSIPRIAPRAQPTPAAGAQTVPAAKTPPVAGTSPVATTPPDTKTTDTKPTPRVAQPTPIAAHPVVQPKPVSTPPVAPAAPRAAQPTPVAPQRVAPPTPVAPQRVAQPTPVAASRVVKPTPAAGVQTATAVSAAPKHPDEIDASALAAAAAAADDEAATARKPDDEEDIDPASSADLIESVSSAELVVPAAMTAAPPPSPRIVTPPPRPRIDPPRVPARPAIPPETKPVAESVTRLASANLPRSPQLDQPELLDLSEGVATKRRSRTGTALVRRRRGAPILMYLALAAAAVAGFFVVVRFFPRGNTDGAAPPSRGSDIAAVAPGSAQERVGSDVATAGSSDVVASAGSDTSANGSSDTTTAIPTATVTPPATHPAGTVTSHPAASHPAGTGTTAVTRPDTSASPQTKPDIKPQTKPDTKPEVVAEDGCDEVSCVLEKYQRECCARFKPAESAFHPKNEIPDSLDKPMVKAGIERVKPKVIACGEKIATKGTVKLAMTVSPDGAITDISVSEAPDQALGECVLAAVKRASFGKSVNGASFTYPFAF